MMAPDDFPCQAWYMPTNGAPKEATLTGWTNASKLWLYSTTRTLHAAQCFESPEATVKAEIEREILQKKRLRKHLADCSVRIAALEAMQAEISQKNNSKV